MITFRNKKSINEWIVHLENHLTLLKANIACEQRQCLIVEKSTKGFKFKSAAKDNLESIRNCASMVDGFLDNASD